MIKKKQERRNGKISTWLLGVSKSKSEIKEDLETQKNQKKIPTLQFNTHLKTILVKILYQKASSKSRPKDQKLRHLNNLNVRTKLGGSDKTQTVPANGVKARDVQGKIYLNRVKIKLREIFGNY